jgi:hypothetical protein
MGWNDIGEPPDDESALPVPSRVLRLTVTMMSLRMPVLTADDDGVADGIRRTVSIGGGGHRHAFGTQDFKLSLGDMSGNG